MFIELTSLISESPVLINLTNVTEIFTPKGKDGTKLFFNTSTADDQEQHHVKEDYETIKTIIKARGELL